VVELICGFEGEDAEEFITRMEQLWKKRGSSERGAKERYELLYGTKDFKLVFIPTVSTKGMQSLVIWGLDHENMQKIIEKAKKLEISVSSQPYIWLNRPPAVLPNERRQS